jgi:ABC-2 type transport system ATP-binding protein
MDNISDDVLAAVKQLNAVKNVKTSDNKLILDIDEPERENPAVVRAIVQAGGNIQYVTELRSTLEDVYLKLIREASAK